MTAIRRVDPRTDPLWHELASGPRGSLFTSPPWIDAVCATYGFEPSGRVVLDDGGRPVGGLAWIDVRDVRGERRTALPFCDRADPMVADAATWAVLADDALDSDLPFTLRALDTSPAVEDQRFSTVSEAAWHTTSLQRPVDELHTAFRPQARRNIARAERAGVKVVLSPELQAITEYHRLHVGLRKTKYRLLAQPQDFFERVWMLFAPTDDVRTALAMVDGRPVAGAVYLVWQDTIYYKFGASLPEFLPLRPNDALHWTVMRWAHARGLKALDWGLSELDQPGLVAYKRKWASTEGRIRTVNAGGSPRGRSRDFETTLRIVTELMTDPAVPDEVTARAGAQLYRIFC